MILHEKQNKVAEDLHRFRVLNCGRRWGKTTLAVEEIKGKVLAKPARVAYIAPTFQQARDIAWLQIKKELLPAITNINESRLEITTRTLKSPDEKSLIVLRGWEAIETLRGQQFDFIVIDEVASMRNFWEHWEEVIRPTLTDTQGEVLFISTPKGFNSFYELYSKDPSQPKVEGIKQDPDFKSFTFNSYDNPFLKKEEIDKAKQELTEDRFEQEYLASFKKMEGLVYKEFKREVHVFNASEPPAKNTIEKLGGVDFGFTNPTGILKVERDSDNHFWVTQEYYKTGRTTPEIIQYTASLGLNKVYPDPAEPDRIEEMRRAGINVQDVSKDVEAGINAVRELFKTNRLHISSECVNLIAELESYHYPDKKPDKNEPESPVKEFDHLVDALRYVLYMQAPLGASTKAHQFYPASVVKPVKRGSPSKIWEQRWIDKPQ